MLYRDFLKMLDMINKCHDITEGCANFVNTNIFTPFNQLVYLLMSQVYDETAIKYILDEWLMGNKTELTITKDNGAEIIIPLETRKDLWKAMEQYKK